MGLSMKNNYMFLILMFCWFTLFIISCEESRVVPTDDTVLSFQTYPFNLDFSKNIQWKLTFVKQGNNILELTEYLPFILFINDSMIYGKDGCNWYSNKYSIVRDTFKSGRSATLLACFQKYFHFSENFRKPFRIRITEKEILFQRSDTIIMFSSIYQRDVTALPFINKTMKMTDSNHPDFTLLDSLQLTPRLILNNKREFSIQWNTSIPDPVVPVNEKIGLFGIASSNNTFYYETDSKYQRGYHTRYDKDLLFVEDVLRCGRYWFTDKALKISNSDGRYFYFTVVE
ncbi:MAG: hypothetical protein HYZ34_04465 [Ignavibacteriae bacterium]|nr:hypothetical protein [Ignavibacteriota bacterium]